MAGLFRRLKSVLSGRRPGADRILNSFEDDRQKLQDDFFQMAASSGKPRGLRWTNCQWLPTYALVQDTQSGLTTLFCGVNLSFEAIEGGDMENVEAVSAIRDGSAVFHHQDGRWGTGGRVLFNVDPETAAQVATPGQTVLKIHAGT